MKVIALAQVYNESLLLDRGFKWIYPLVDQIVISEGKLTPFGNLSLRSTDTSREVIQEWVNKDKSGKIVFIDAVEGSANNREQSEGNNKNNLLRHSSVEHGDLIFIWDIDEFWFPSRFISVVDKFRRNDTIEHVPVQEYQFAYNLHLYFNAEHNGRFMRYVDGAKFGSTNHFIYPDGRDISKDYSHLVKREETQMCHLCWVKSPHLIREKVLSFNRPSFTAWYNRVYLKWPFNPEGAYLNNNTIPPHYGKGFAEGQQERIQEFIGVLPYTISDLDVDWLPYIINNHDKLVI